MNTPTLNFASGAPVGYGPNQTIGVNATFTVPDGIRIQLISIQIVLVADANLANRVVAFRPRAGTTGPPLINWGITQTASTTEIYEACPAYNQETQTKTHPNVNDTHFCGCPSMILDAGDTIQTIIGNIQATDVVQLNLQVLQWAM